MNINVCVEKLQNYILFSRWVAHMIPPSYTDVILDQWMIPVPLQRFPDSDNHGTNTGPTWVLSAPDGPHVGPMNLAIWVSLMWRVTRGLPVTFMAFSIRRWWYLIRDSLRTGYVFRFIFHICQSIVFISTINSVTRQNARNAVNRQRQSEEYVKLESVCGIPLYSVLSMYSVEIFWNLGYVVEIIKAYLQTYSTDHVLNINIEVFLRNCSVIHRTPLMISHFLLK